jgi:hypothetical protein
MGPQTCTNVTRTKAGCNSTFLRQKERSRDVGDTRVQSAPVNQRCERVAPQGVPKDEDGLGEGLPAGRRNASPGIDRWVPSAVRRPAPNFQSAAGQEQGNTGGAQARRESSEVRYRFPDHPSHLYRVPSFLARVEAPLASCLLAIHARRSAGQTGEELGFCK